MRVRVKVWFEQKGEQVFGSGKAAILRAVDETGSLNAAAAQLGMSYRHVWTAIRTAEDRLGKSLLTKQRGGRKGGGAKLTQYARTLVERFDRIDSDIREHADRASAI